jgi:Secretion system C-terminal sorting domain
MLDSYETFTHLTIFNLSGQLLKTQEVEKGNRKAIIEVSNLQQGTYLLNVTDANGKIASRTFVKN